MGTCRQQHCLAWLGLVLLVEAAAVSSATAVPAAASATAVQHATVAVQQPLWLQDAVRNSKQPGLSSRQTGQDQKQPRHPPASAQPLQTVAAAPYIMLKRSHTVKHSHRVSAPKDMTVRISSRGGMRGGVLYRTGPISQGHTTSVTFRCASVSTSSSKQHTIVRGCTSLQACSDIHTQDTLKVLRP
jgi:hypothetical protein